MMGKRKRKTEALLPCSTNRMSDDMNDEGELEKKVVPLVSESGQSTNCEVRNEDETMNLCGIPLERPSQSAKSGVTFVLEKASLSLAYLAKRYQILSSDEHADYLRKKNLDPYSYRPDIVHEALLQIMDSRLRMAGRLKAVFIRTDEGILIKIEPNAHIPRTLRSFCNMMAQLLQKMSIKDVGKHGKILRVVDNPVSKHLPANAHIVGLSFSSQKAVQLRDYVGGISRSEDFVFVVGVMAHGKIDCDYLENENLISVSHYHLSAGVCLRRICIALERRWSIC